MVVDQKEDFPEKEVKLETKRIEIFTHESKVTRSFSQEMKVFINRGIAGCLNLLQFSLSEGESFGWPSPSRDRNSQSSSAMSQAHQPPDTWSRAHVVAWYGCVPGVQFSCI